MVVLQPNLTAEFKNIHAGQQSQRTAVLLRQSMRGQLAALLLPWLAGHIPLTLTACG